MTNPYNNRLRTALSLGQPTGAWTNGFIYDTARRLTNVTSQAGSFGYELGGSSSTSTQIKKLFLPNTSYITNTYDSVARLTGTWLKNSTNGTLNSHEYVYNLSHQRTQQVFNAGSTYSYSYDNIGQLTFGDSATASEDRRYVYDAAWNLNYRTNNTTLYTFKVDTRNQLTNVTTVGKQTYDDNGNLTLASSTGGAGWVDTECVYDDENRLVNWYHYYDTYAGSGVPTGSPDDRRTEFVYDGLGRLRKRVEYEPVGSTWSVVSETRYIYDGMRLIQERNSSNTPTVSYTRGSDLSGSLEVAGGIGGLLARSHGYSSGTGNWSTHNCYHADGNGNVTYLVNSSQGLAAKYRYDPYGNTISQSGSLSSANVYRFSSKEIHVNSGLYYYGYRFYAPSLQRWLNRDPIQEMFDINLYRCVYNSPLDYADVNGLWPTGAWGSENVHGNSTDRALSFLPESDRKVLRDAQVDADQDQSAEGSYKHAMRDARHKQTPQDAKDWANKYVRNTLKVARCFERQGKHTDALQALGDAMHVLQDSTSPMHQGFQGWDGRERSLDALRHGRGENFDPGAGSALDAATKAAWDYFTGAVPMPADFFNLGYDTPKQKK